MPERFEGQEAPKVPERAAEQAERRLEGAEVVEQAVGDAVGTVDAKAAALASVDAKTIMEPGDVPASELAGDAAFAESQKEMGAVQDEARGLVGRTKDKLSGVLTKLKRYGRVATAAGVIAGAAFPASEAAAHDPGPRQKVEHVEKEKGAAPWNAVLEATERKVMGDKELLDQMGEAGRREMLESITSWDQERARQAAADLAGLDVEKIGRDGYKSVEIWSETEFRARQEQAFPRLPDNMDAQADNDRIRFRASRFLRPDGKVDVGKVHKGAAHEFLHVITTAETGGGEQERLWDKAGVPQEFNEGVAELLALRMAQKEGVSLENHQAYAGGNLAAARLVEGVVGQKALYADYLEGKTDRIKGAIDAKFGKGSADRIFAKRMDLGEEGDTLGMVLELSKAGADVRALWEQAKAEGFMDDVTVAADEKAVTISRDIEGKMLLANTFVSEGERVSDDIPEMRVIASTLKAGIQYGNEGVAKAAAGVHRLAEVKEGARQQLRKEIDALAEEYRAAQRAGDEKKLKELDPPENMPAIYAQAEPGRMQEALRQAHARGDGLADANAHFNTRDAVADMQKRYEAAATAEERSAVRRQIESANEQAARDAAKQIRLENLTPPIPEKK